MVEAGGWLRATSGRHSFRHLNRWPAAWNWAALLVATLLIFSGLRMFAANHPQPVALPSEPGTVVVVGTTGHYALTAGDRKVLQEQSAVAQVGAVSVRPRDIGDCAAAGWATLGAGRRTSVGALCEPRVVNGRVADWPERLAAAETKWGDAKLGTLAASVPGCVMAVGEGAALAAARPDGSLDRYQTVPQFLAAGATTPCPLTLVDAGRDADPVVAALLQQPGVTVIVTGIGPPPGSSTAGLQVIYRIGSGPAGWLTSASTRRSGVVTLPDLTRTLIEGRQSAAPPNALLDGAPIGVLPNPVSVAEEEEQLHAISSLSGAVRVADIALSVAGAVLVVVLLLGLSRRRLDAPRLILALGTVLPAAMMLTGAVPWNRTSFPGLALGAVLAAWTLVLTATALRLARVAKAPVALVGAALSVAAFTLDAALGGVMQPGSMLNSQPTNGGRWYGFGNVTFAAYAASGLVLAGLVAHRLSRAGHRVAGLIAAAVIGFGVVVCDGWPSMGADFGGVLALTPGVLWLLLSLSGLVLTWRKVVAIGASTLVLVTLVAWADWLRGPTARTHAGAFFQRILEGDAADVVARKAIASAESLVSPLGIVALLAGIALWVVIFRTLPQLSAELIAPRPLAGAVLATAVLGTVLNDGGVTVWLTVSAAFALSIGSLWVSLAPNATQSPIAGARSRRRRRSVRDGPRPPCSKRSGPQSVRPTSARPQRADRGHR